MDNPAQSKPQPRHLAILGAGAVGLTLAAFLRHGGHHVTLITRDGSPIQLPLRFQDDIGKREFDLAEVETCRASDMHRRPDHLVVCTRGEQLASAMDSLRSNVDADVPVTVAAATLDDLCVLARERGLRTPLHRMAVGFAAWPVSRQRHRVFSLRPRGGSAIARESGSHRPDDLASILSNAGLPAQAAPTTLFRWVFHSTLAVEIARLLGFREAGWDLDTLAARPDLMSRCAQAMHEAAFIARDGGGPIGWMTSALPRSAFHLMLKHRTRHASEGFREVWRYHGPKTDAQLDFIAGQLIRRANGRSTAALSAFVRSSGVV